MKRDKAEADYLILGNSTAAIGAVEGIRRQDAGGRLIVVSRERHHTYSRPLISYLLAGEIRTERMDYRPRDFYAKNAVEAMLGVEALKVDPARRRVETTGGAIRYGRLLVATGGRPVIPPIKGLAMGKTKGVFTFTSWDDALEVDRFIEGRKPAMAVVIGGGLIGIKAAEALRARGVEVAIVEMAERILPLALDGVASRMAAESVRRAGVALHCGATVGQLESRRGEVTGVVLRPGGTIACGLVIVAAGVAPETGLVHGSGIRTGRGIAVDERCATSAERVFAAGDVVEARNELTGENRPIPIFPAAYRQGAVAGTNMAGGDARTAGIIPMNAIEFFGLPTISVGLAAASGDGYEVLEKSDDSGKEYRRIVLKGNRMVGALLAGNIERAGILTGLIREKVDVSRIRHLLASGEFGLISLPADYRKHVVRGEGIEV